MTVLMRLGCKRQKVEVKNALINLHPIKGTKGRSRTFRS